MSTDPTAFLYPFIESDERDAGPLLAELAASARRKFDESRSLQAATLARCERDVQAAADAIAARRDAGGSVHAFGTGGSATDAEAAAHRFRRLGVAAQNLAADPAILTALANDVGFDLVFSRQLIAHGDAGDVAIAFSTSGGSANVVEALITARRLGLLTVAIVGYDGGLVAERGLADHCLVVESSSVHRIQECQDGLLRSLVDLVGCARTGGQS